MKRVNDDKWDTAAPHVVVPLMVRFKEKEGKKNIFWDYLIGREQVTL